MTCRQGQNFKRLLILSLSFSIIVHLAFILFFLKFPDQTKNLEASQEIPVEVRILSQSDSSSLIESLRGQIVDLTDNLTESKPNKYTRYLSDKDRRVDKEMQSQVTGLDPNAAFTSMGGGRDEDIISLNENERSVRMKENKGYMSQEDTKKGLDLTPSAEELSRLVALAPNNYLPGVEIGNATLLNTREFAFAGYFVRMKRQMEAVWDPRPVLYRTSTEKKPMYITSVSMVLDEKGKVLSANIERSSQVKELDEEAMRTIRQSSPYPNPPKELLAGDSKIYIPDWNFVITYSKNLF